MPATAVNFLTISLVVLLFIPSTTKVTFLTSTLPPFSDCTKYVESDSTSILGAEVQLLRSAFSIINWTEGLQYDFKCASNFSSLFTSFYSEQNTEIGILGGISITSERFDDGFTFSQPTVSGSLPLVYRRVSKGWFFRRGLDVMGWGILLLTVIVMGGILYFLENRQTAYINMLYNAFCQFFWVPDYPLSNYTSKIVHYFSTFLVTLVVIIFTAVSTNIFYNDKMIGKVLSLSSLEKETIYTNTAFFSYLEQFNVQPVSIDEIDPIEFLTKIEELDIRYIVVDGPYSDFLVKQHCNLYTATNEIEIIHYGLMFSKQVPRLLRNQFNNAIIQAKQTKDFDQHVTEYYNSKQDFYECTSKELNQSDSVTLYETRGLWYILACGIGIAVGFFILNLFGVAVNKNLRVYGLKGIRARLDRKIQRRTASVFALHAAVSMQAIGYLRKINQEALSEWITAYKNCFSENLVRIYYHKIAYDFGKKNSPKSQEKVRPKGKSKEGSEKLDGSFLRISSALGWLRRRPSSEITKKNSLPLQQKSPSIPLNSPIPIATPSISIAESKVTKKEMKRSSTLLKQGMKNYKLGKSFEQKIGLQLDDSSTFNPKDCGYTEGTTSHRNSRALKGLINFEKMAREAPRRSMSLFKRCWGKKGMKINKHIAATAKALLEQKETILLKEFERKKTEIFNRGNPADSPLLRSVRCSILSAQPDTRRPSLFLLNARQAQSVQLNIGSNNLFVDRASRRSVVKPINDIQEESSSQSENRLTVKKNTRRIRNSLFEAERKDFEYYQPPQRRSFIINIPISLNDEWDFNLQSEGVTWDASSGYNLAKYDFSQVVQGSLSATKRSSKGINKSNGNKD